MVKVGEEQWRPSRRTILRGLAMIPLGAVDIEKYENNEFVIYKKE